MPNILLVVKHAQQEMENARTMHRIALETSTTSEIAEGKTAKGATAGGDSRKLRGIPCLSKGVGGAIAGSSPHQLPWVHDRD